MLPEVSLRDVCREDVYRVARWLEDEEVSSGWLGQDTSERRTHRGYDPYYVLEASEPEWDSVFRYDPARLILSIYNAEGEHVGECQLLFDDSNGAGLSVLIGRKDLWHQGYGTSTVMLLLDKVFHHFKLDRVWVNIPEDNVPAIGLFTKLGFVLEDTCVPENPRELCQFGCGVMLNECILALKASEYDMRPLTLHQAWEDVDIFRGLSIEQIDKVASLGQSMRISAGETLGKAGELGGHLFFITEGQAQLTAHSAIGEMTVRIAGPGESFPLAALIGSGTLITSAEAMTDMSLLTIPRAQLLALCAEDTGIGMRIYATIAEVLARRYANTLEHLTSSVAGILKEADFFANI